MSELTQDFWVKVYNRSTRLILTLVSKQWLAFYVATVLIWFKAITPEVWAVAMGIVVGADITQKVKGVE